MVAMTESLLMLGLLGAAHGINPAMGWLFAVGLGFQEQDRRAVWRALGPMAFGHAAAILVAVLAASLIGLVLPPAAIKGLVSGLLLGFGVYHLVRHAHPRRGGGMRVGRRDLALWSFLVASAHGAGLMALPFVLGGTAATAAHASHGAHAAAEAADAAVQAAGHAGHVLAAGLPAGHIAGLLATLVHTAGYLLVTGLIAVIVYEKLGLAMLRKVWINLNAIWAGALILTGVLTVLL